MYLRFLGLVALIALPIFAGYIILLMSPETKLMMDMPSEHGENMRAVIAGMLYFSLMVGWIAAHTVLYRFPDQLKLLMLGFLLCAALLAFAFSQSPFLDDVSDVGSNFVKSAVVIVGSIVGAALQFGLVLVFFQVAKSMMRFARRNNRSKS